MSDTSERLEQFASSMDDAAARINARLAVVERLLRDQLGGGPAEFDDAELVGVLNALEETREAVNADMVQPAYNLKVELGDFSQ